MDGECIYSSWVFMWRKIEFTTKYFVDIYIVYKHTHFIYRKFNLSWSHLMIYVSGQLLRKVSRVNISSKTIRSIEHDRKVLFLIFANLIISFIHVGGIETFKKQMSEAIKWDASHEESPHEMHHMRNRLMRCSWFSHNMMHQRQSRHPKKMAKITLFNFLKKTVLHNWFW